MRLQGQLCAAMHSLQPILRGSALSHPVGTIPAVASQGPPVPLRQQGGAYVDQKCVKAATALAASAALQAVLAMCLVHDSMAGSLKHQATPCCGNSMHCQARHTSKPYSAVQATITCSALHAEYTCTTKQKTAQKNNWLCSTNYQCSRNHQ